jgi:hypothetical protein
MTTTPTLPSRALHLPEPSTTIGENNSVGAAGGCACRRVPVVSGCCRRSWNQGDLDIDADGINGSVRLARRQARRGGAGTDYAG